MRNPFWPADEQLERLNKLFPRSRGGTQLDDRWVLNGKIFTIHDGLRWRDASLAYGSQNRSCNRRDRRRDMGFTAGMIQGLAAKGSEQETFMTVVSGQASLVRAYLHKDLKAPMPMGVRLSSS